MYFFYCFTGPHWISLFVKWAPCIKIIIIIIIIIIIRQLSTDRNFEATLLLVISCN